MNKLVAISMAALMVTGCATKRYGRLSELSGAESQYYTCREIELEIAKVEAYRQQVSNGAQIDWRSIAGFLGDYGIGNAMEKSEADRSATRRMNGLLALKAQNQCFAPGMAMAPAATLGQYVPATPPVVQASAPCGQARRLEEARQSAATLPCK